MNDRAAFAMKWLHYAGVCCLNAGLQRADVEDVKQDCLYKLLTKPLPEDLRSPEAWAKTIIRNTLFDHLRARSVRREHEILNPLVCELHHKADWDCEKRLLDVLHADNCVTQATRTDREEAVLMLFGIGCTDKQAAAHLKITVPCVKSIKYRTQLRLERVA